MEKAYSGVYVSEASVEIADAPSWSHQVNKIAQATADTTKQHSLRELNETADVSHACMLGLGTFVTTIVGITFPLDSGINIGHGTHGDL